MSKTNPPPSRREGKYWVKELYIMSYIVSKALELNDVDYCNITTFAKLCTNYVIDWQENIKPELSGVPVAGYEPNWFGNVAYIRGPVIDQESSNQSQKRTKNSSVSAFGNVACISGPIIDQESSNQGQKRMNNSSVSAYEDRIFINRIDKMPQSLWHIEEKNGSKIVTPLHSSSYFKSNLRGEDRKLLSGENLIGEKNFLIARMNSQDLYKLYALSLIYKNFNLKELNILASHRDLKKSQRCLNYICKEWSRQFGKILNMIGRKSENDAIGELEIKLCADFCEQIHTKIDFIVNGVPECLGKIDDVLVDTINKGYEHALLEDIRKNVYERAPRQDDGKSDDYFNELRFIYKIYRSEICPMTRTLLELAMEENKKKGVIFKWERNKFLCPIDKIPNAEKEVLFDKLEFEEVLSDFDFIDLRNRYQNLKNKQKIFACSDRYSDFEIKESLLEVRDGSGETWN